MSCNLHNSPNEAELCYPKCPIPTQVGSISWGAWGHCTPSLSCLYSHGKPEGAVPAKDLREVPSPESVLVMYQTRRLFLLVLFCFKSLLIGSGFFFIL